MTRIFVSALALIGASTATAAAATFTAKVQVPSKLLDIRGGAGPLDPTTAAKILGGLNLASGIVGTTGNKFNAELYGLDDLNDTDMKLHDDINTSILSSGLIAYCLLFRDDVSRDLALGLSSLPWAARSLGSLLNNDAATVGPSKAGDLAILGFNVASAYGGLAGAEWATTAFKAASVFALFSGVPCLFDATTTSKMWEIKGVGKNTNGFINGLGSVLVQLGSLQAFLAWGDDTLTAFGKAALVGLLAHSKMTFASPDFAALGVEKSKLMVWEVVFAVVAASMLL